MGLADRDYYRQDRSAAGRGFGTTRVGLPRPTRVVTWLLIVNVAVFIITAIAQRITGEASLFAWGSASSTASPHSALQLWRYITYQYLHGGTFHLLFNMLGLYFFGPPLERSWGSWRFLTFYSICGATGGILFVLLSLAGVTGGYLIGASGAVLGLLAACAILFPQTQIVLLFFLVPIRVATVLLAAVYALSVISSANPGSDICHLAGMATGAAWVWSGPIRFRFALRRRDNAWRRKLEAQQRQQQEIDRILGKIQKQGIGSLTRREKKILQRATEQQRQHDHF